MPAPAVDFALLVLCIAVAGGASILLRQDTNWDLQNYHYYNPWAWWNGRIFGTDIAPAQLQTFHNPVLDLPFYFMVAAGWPPRVIAFCLAIPAGVAAFFLAKLVRLLFADLPRGERPVAQIAAFAIGVTSAMGIATLGTTMNEWPLVALTLPALWLVVRDLVGAPARALRVRTLVIAGLLCGIATGVKLTAGSFAVAFCLALLLRGPYAAPALRRALREALVYGLAVLAGFAIAYGPWGYQLWSHYASPVFPYGNEWIDSPWWVKATVIGRRYGPHNFVDWLTFPFALLDPKPFLVTEVPYRDARMPILYALALGAGTVWLWVRAKGRDALPPIVHAGVSRAWQFLTLFFVVSFLLWTAQHSNYRYLVTLDMLAGALIVTLLFRNLRPGYAPAVALLLAVALIATTRPGTWGRVDFGDAWFVVRMPTLESNALVVLASDAPMAHVVPQIRPEPAHALGIHNGLIDVRRSTRMEEAIDRTIQEHDGPIYALVDPPRNGIDALLGRGLLKVTDTCAPVHTNMVTAPLEICRAVRVSDAEKAP